MYYINVLHKYHDVCLDEKINKKAGKQSASSGYYFQENLRDLQYTFRNKEKAYAVAAEIRKIKGVRARVVSDAKLFAY